LYDVTSDLSVFQFIGFFAIVQCVGDRRDSIRKLFSHRARHYGILATRFER